LSTAGLLHCLFKVSIQSFCLSNLSLKKGPDSLTMSHYQRVHIHWGTHQNSPLIDQDTHPASSCAFSRTWQRYPSQSESRPHSPVVLVVMALRPAVGRAGQWYPSQSKSPPPQVSESPSQRFTATPTRAAAGPAAAAFRSRLQVPSPTAGANSGLIAFRVTVPLAPQACPQIKPCEPHTLWAEGGRRAFDS
jgi:hypothetical protein